MGMVVVVDHLPMAGASPNHCHMAVFVFPLYLYLCLHLNVYLYLYLCLFLCLYLCIYLCLYLYHTPMAGMSSNHCHITVFVSAVVSVFVPVFVSAFVSVFVSLFVCLLDADRRLCDL